MLNIPERLWSPISVEDLRFWFFNPGMRLLVVLYHSELILSDETEPVVPMRTQNVPLLS